MKVQEIMTRNVKSCKPEANLAAAAMMMWDGDCGIIPIVDENENALGVITDRDICIAVATKSRPASEIKVDEVFSHQLYSCKPEDNLHKCMDLMKDRQVRRIPVVNKSGKLQGIVSLNDIAIEVKRAKTRKELDAPDYEDVVETLKAICTHHSKVLSPQGRNVTNIEAVA